MILVTGATGRTGGATLKAVAETGAPVRAFVRDSDKLRAPDGVEVAVGTFDNPASLDAALDGVDHAYLVLNASPDAVALEGAFVDAAVRAGIEHVVLLSVLGADDAASEALRLGTAHRATERTIRESGLGWTFLRPNGFLQNYLGQAASIASDDVFYSSLTTGAPVSHVDVIDIGAVAAKSLTEPGHEGKAYTLTGPEALTDDDIAARLSAVLDREIKHVTVPPEAVGQSLRDMGVPEWTIDGLGELWAFYETGAAAGVAPDIEQVLGRPARSVDDFIADNRAAFGG